MPIVHADLKISFNFDIDVADNTASSHRVMLVSVNTADGLSKITWEYPFVPIQLNETPDQKKAWQDIAKLIQEEIMRRLGQHYNNIAQAIVEQDKNTIAQAVVEQDKNTICYICKGTAASWQGCENPFCPIPVAEREKYFASF